MTVEDESVLRVLHSDKLPPGVRAVIRPARSDDVDDLVALFERLSPEDRQKRFFSMFHPDRAFVGRMVSLTDRGGAMLVAELRGADRAELPRLVGEAGYSLRDDGDGSLGITVDRVARGWLATTLLDALFEQAALHGVRNLHAETLLGNRPMLALARARGCATVDGEDRAVVDAIVGTTGPTPSWPRTDHPRVLVEIPGARWRHAPDLVSGGVDVIACGGPSARPKDAPCPMLRGERCPLVEDADVVVYALRSSDPEARALLDAHARTGTEPLLIEQRDEPGYST